jgi:hypothetical protein
MLATAGQMLASSGATVHSSDYKKLNNTTLRAEPHP